MAQNPTLGHGVVGKREQGFTRLLPENPKAFDEASLARLAEMMIVTDDELNDGADAEENLAVPAGYTYFGQFVDHDLTLDTTSSFAAPTAAASSLRTPALDLDCVYGAGPQDQPYMYDVDGATLLLPPGGRDLMRQPAGPRGRAVIGDKRNDENSIVCQIQLAKFHNAVVAKIRDSGDTGDLFERARKEVTWTYQRVVLEDYLLRIINTHTYDFFTQRRAALGEGAYDLYTADLRTNLPKEFVGAAYRFGHSMVRRGYRLNNETKRVIFVKGSDSTEDSLVGFQPLPASHLIDDWRRFFTPSFAIPVMNGPEPVENNPAVRLQWAYKIDPSLVDPLAALPPSVAGGASLAALNLKRGNLPSYALATGQTFAAKLHEKPLGKDELMVRSEGENGSTFKSIGAADQRFLTETPLWFYILAEAQVPVLNYWREVGQRDLNAVDFASGPCSVSQLGPVGGRILMEVFNGIVDADDRSFRSAAPAGWVPIIGNDISFYAILKFIGLAP
jgi:Animal haem peroxidase